MRCQVLVVGVADGVEVDVDSMSPGMTVMPDASMTLTPGGTLSVSRLPTATIVLPSMRMTA